MYLFLRGEEARAQVVLALNVTENPSLSAQTALQLIFMFSNDFNLIKYGFKMSQIDLLL